MRIVPIKGLRYNVATNILFCGYIASLVGKKGYAVVGACALYFNAHPSLDLFTASLIATARYYPKAVISNITALVIHSLSDEGIDRIDVDIPRN